MYQMTRGDDEWSSLVTRPSTSAPVNTGPLYQSDISDSCHTYGAVNKVNSPVSDNNTNKNSEENLIGL